MDSFKSIAKGGWHPEKKKAASSSSSSGDNERFKNFKGLQQVANWTGHGTKGGSSQNTTTSSRPLHTLKDPDSFGAPPRRDPNAPIPPPTRPGVLEEDQQPQAPVQQQQQRAAATQEEQAPAPRGYRADTTGYNTSNLPPPPRRVLGTTGASSNSTGGSRPTPSIPSGATGGRPTPPLPNRQQPPPLPGRQPSAGSRDNTSSFPAATSYGVTASTAAASSRLAQAGVSVPGFDIGGGASSPSPTLPSRNKPPPPPRSSTTPSSPPPAYSIGELSSRFGSLRHTPGTSATSSGPEEQTSTTAAPAKGTSWAQKTAAVKTLAQAREDPRSVSVSDVTSAARTANNFQQRHGDQVAQGFQRAKAAGLVDGPPNIPGNRPGASADAEESRTATTGVAAARSMWGDVATRASRTGSTYSNHSASSEVTSPTIPAVEGKKKPPPPPKPKPRALEVSSSGDAPPPIPMGTKPR